MIFLADQCSHRRNQRPHASADRPAALLSDEHKLAVAAKTKLEAHLERSKALCLRIAAVQSDLVRIIKERSASLGLNSETRATGPTVAYILTGEEFPCVPTAQTLAAEAATHCARNRELVADLTVLLKHARESIEHALRESTQAERQHEVPCVCVSMLARLTSIRRTARSSRGQGRNQTCREHGCTRRTPGRNPARDPPRTTRASVHDCV